MKERRIYLTISVLLFTFHLFYGFYSEHKKHEMEIKKAFLLGQQVELYKCLSQYHEVQTELESLYKNPFLVEHNLLDEK